MTLLTVASAEKVGSSSSCVAELLRSAYHTYDLYPSRASGMSVKGCVYLRVTV